MYHIFVICSIVIGHLGYFFDLAIVNSAINIEGTGLFLKNYDFSQDICRIVELLGYTVICLVF